MLTALIRSHKLLYILETCHFASYMYAAAAQVNVISSWYFTSVSNIMLHNSMSYRHGNMSLLPHATPIKVISFWVICNDTLPIGVAASLDTSLSSSTCVAAIMPLSLCLRFEQGS